MQNIFKIHNSNCLLEYLDYFFLSMRNIKDLANTVSASDKQQNNGLKGK